MIAGKKTDPVWQDVARLAAVPVMFSAPSIIGMWAWLATYRDKPKPDVRTILHRMGHMIFKTSVNPRIESIEVAKWYLEHLPRVPLLPDDMRLTRNFALRIRQNIELFEARWGWVDTSGFNILLSVTDWGPDVILYGPAIIDSGRYNNSPDDILYLRIQYYAWRQNYL